MQPRIHDFLFDTHYNFTIDNPLIVRYDQPGNVAPPRKCDFLLLSAPTDHFKLLNGGNFLLLCAG